MKKITTLLTTLLLTVTTLTLTSCNGDEEISNTLWGVWEGHMESYYTYGDYTYSVSRTILSFDKDPYYYASGTGYWIDYFSGASFDYYATHIEWTVSNGNIRIHSLEDDEYWYIYEYGLGYNYFTGYIDGESGNSMSFSLYKTSAPNLYDYNWGWSSYYDDYGYYNAKQLSRSANTSVERPVRHFGKPAKQ